MKLYTVQNQEYIISFSPEKFKKLEPYDVANLIDEITNYYDSEKNEISDAALKKLFEIGLENKTKKKSVPSNMAKIHLERLINQNGKSKIKEIVLGYFSLGMPKFIESL